MANIGNFTASAKLNFIKANVNLYGIDCSGYANKRVFPCNPGGADLLVSSISTSVRRKDLGSVGHLNFLIKDFRRKSRPVKKLSINMQIEGNHAENAGPETGSTVNFPLDRQSADPSTGDGGNEIKDVYVSGTPEILSEVKKGSSKIHDFCFGIPFGSIILGGGVVGFLFSRSQATLINGVLFGGALLALSYYSLKVWRQGKSCSPFILGQSVLATGLLVKQCQIYALSKKVFPTGFYIVMSAGMLCFYMYVLLSGGNPPPKKFKGTAN